MPNPMIEIRFPSQSVPSAEPYRPVITDRHLTIAMDAAISSAVAANACTTPSENNWVSSDDLDSGLSSESSPTSSFADPGSAVYLEMRDTSAATVSAKRIIPSSVDTEGEEWRSKPGDEKDEELRCAMTPRPHPSSYSVISLGDLQVFTGYDMDAADGNNIADYKPGRS